MYKISDKESKAIVDMFKFYNITHTDYYPFSHNSNYNYCFFVDFSSANFHISKIRAYFLCFVKYQIIPFSFIHKSNINTLADLLLRDLHLTIKNVSRVQKEYLGE